MQKAGTKGTRAGWRIARLPAVIGIAVLLQACIINAGDDHDDRERFRRQQPTVGQELIDLDRARASGAISEAEYERLKRNIIDATD